MGIFPTKILLATDGSEDAELAATTVAALAKVTDSELHVINVGVVAPAPLAPLDVEPARVEQETRKILEEQIKKIEYMGRAVALSHARMGNAAREIVNLAEEIEVGLIAVGSRGRGRMKRLLMGSVSDAVVRYAHCPVLVVLGKPIVFPAKILLATDGSEEATLAARVASDLAHRTGSELHLVTVAPEYPYVYDAYYNIGRTEDVERSRQEAREILDQQVDVVRESGSGVAEAHLKMGVADEEIVVLAEDLQTDLIIIGCKGLGGMRLTLIGNVSDSVVRHAHCPVMVVRGMKEATLENE